MGSIKLLQAQWGDVIFEKALPLNGSEEVVATD